MNDKLEPSLGVHLLGTITKGMYSNPLHCIREYVQNAYDSIRQARRQGLIGDDDGTVKIVVDAESRTLKIRDNGTGLTPEAAVVRLVDIGSSQKATSAQESNVNAGFRGIGRMAGISYCDVLRFETSDGKGRKTIVTFDAKAINKLTETGQAPTTIIQAIDENCTAEDVTAPNDDHYLEVTLDGLDSDSIFLSREGLSEYLGQVGPVPFDPRTWKFMEDIKLISAAINKTDSLEQITVQICSADGKVIEDVRRPYKNKFRSGGKRDRQVNVSSVTKLPLVGGVTGDFWGWLAVHKWENQLKDAPFAGLRIRMHNIEIGDHILIRDLFKTPSLSTWCFGEIHITDYSVTPNAQRDNFQESKNWEAIKRRLKDDLSELERRIRKESETRNASAEVLSRKAKKVISETEKKLNQGIESKEEQAALVENLKRQEETINSAKSQRNRTDQEKQQLNQTSGQIQTQIKKIENISHTHSDKAMAHLDRQTRSVVKKIFTILRSELEESVFFNVQKKINEAIKPGQNC